MNKLAKTKIVLSSFLFLILLTSSLYFVLNEELRVDIGKTYSTFKVLEDGKWVVSGVEYTKLMDGTKNMRASIRTLNTTTEGNLTTVERIAYFKEGCKAIDTYVFDSSTNETQLFPISHKVNTLGCQDYTLIYEVTKLEYFGQTDYDIGSSHEFGHKMKVEWQDGNYYERLYKYANRNEGKLTIKYRPDENFTISVRLFDPIISEDTVFTKLISNKASLTRGEAIFEINNPVNLSVDDLFFSHYLDRGNQITSDSFYVQVTEKVKTPKHKDYIIEKTYTELNNQTGLNETKKVNMTTKLEDGFKLVSQISWKQVDTIPKGKNLIKYKANWIAHTGPQEIDWFVNINLDKVKYELPKDKFGKMESIFLKSYKWAWWNESWEKKREIKIKENSGANLTNYTILLNITYDSDMQTDFDDLRFSNSAENGELDYWIEKKVDGSWVSVWVEVPSLTANINTSIKMYYDNSAVSTTSDFNTPFLFSDDFEDGTSGNLPGGWTVQESAGTIRISNFTSNTGNKSVKIDDTGNQVTKLRAYVQLPTDKSSINYHYSQQWTGTGYILSGVDNTTLDEEVAVAKTSVYSGFQGNSIWLYYSEGAGVNLGAVNTNWHNYSIIANTTDYISILQDGIENISIDTLNSPVDSFRYIQLWAFGGGASGNGYFDDIFIHEQVTPEPSYVLEAEETYTIATLTANSTKPDTVYTNTDWTVNLTATDPDESYIDSYVQFYVEDVKTGSEITYNMTNNTNHLVATLSSDNFSYGNTLIAEVWIGDRTTNTSKVNLTSESVYAVKTITLNSPDDNYYDADGSILFNCSASVEGITLANMSLWTNQGGIWEVKNITFFSVSNSNENYTDNSNRLESSNFNYNVTALDVGYLEHIDAVRFATSSSNNIKVTITQNGDILAMKTGDNGGEVYNVTFNESDYSSFINVGLFNVKIENGGAGCNPSRGSFINFTGSLFTISSQRINTLAGFGSSSQSSIKYVTVTKNSSTSIWNRTISASTLWTCKGCDSANDCNFAPTNRTAYLDEQNPLVNIIYPLNTTYIVDVTQLNYSSSDSNPDKCWYSNDSGTTNYSIQTFGNNFTSMASNEGSNTWTVYCNDTLGNENSSNIVFLKDTLYPQIEYTADSDASNISGNFTDKDWIWMNVSVVDVNIKNYTFWTWTSLNSSFNKTIFNSTSNSYSMNLTGLSQNVYFWNVTVCDVVNRCNTTDERYYGVEKINFSIDGFYSNQSVELGGDLNITATSTYDLIWIDVDHPSYGTNYSSGKWTNTLELLIDWFRKTIFSDSSSSKEFNFTSGFDVIENMTFNITSHQYDEVVNLSFNITGTNNPINVTFYGVNSTDYDRVFYGNLTSDGYIKQNKLVDKGFAPYGYNKTQNISFDNEGTKYLYFYLDDAAKLVSFLLNVSSIEYGFEFSDSFANADYIDLVLSDITFFNYSITPNVNNIMEFLYDDFDDASINHSHIYVTPDETTTGREDRYDRFIANSESGGSLNLYSREYFDIENFPTTDLDFDQIENIFYLNNSDFNVWSNQNSLYHFQLSTESTEWYTADYCDYDIDLYFGGALVYSNDYYGCYLGTNSDCTATLNSDITINLTKTSENGYYSAQINGTDTFISYIQACGDVNYTRNWNNNSWSFLYSGACDDIYGELTNPVVFYNADHSQAPVYLYTRNGALIEYYEPAYAGSSCVGDGMMYLVYPFDMWVYCADATSEGACEALDNSVHSGSCSWQASYYDDEGKGCAQNIVEASITNINRSLGIPQTSTVVSNSVFDSATNINSITSTVYGNLTASGTTYLFVSGDNGDNWQNFVNGVNTPITNSGQHQKWMATMNFTDPGYVSKLPYISSIAMETEPSNISNVTFDFGEDGIIDYTINGEFKPSNGTVQVNLSNASILTAFTGTASIGHTHILPLVIGSDSAGVLRVEGISLIYNPNPVLLTISYIQDFLTNFGNLITNFTVMFDASGNNSQVNVSDIKYDYAGGNKTHIVTVHNNDSSESLSRNLTFYYSYWDYSWVPEDVEWIFFNPTSPTAKNLKAYGQTDSIPILNITNYGYGGKNATLSVYLNDTLSCVNLTLSLDNNKSNGYTLNSSWQDLANMSFLDTEDIYLWMDYDCSPNSNWEHYFPYLSFRQCVVDGICSEVVI